MRDLEAARLAYTAKNEDLSRQAHNTNGGLKVQEEGHRPHGDLIKSVIYGGLDGILTTFALVSGAAGSNAPISVVLVLGFAGAFADGLAMGLGDALSAKAETEHVFQERNREFWEYDHYLEGEISEMVELYVARGMTRQDAETVVNLMAPHRSFFVEIMTVEELGLTIPDEDDNPWKDGFVTFASFVVFGSVPLLGYCFFPLMYSNASDKQLFYIAWFLTLATLFALGAIKSIFSQKSAMRSGSEMVAIGAFVAVIAYYIGLEADRMVGASQAGF